MFFKQNIWLNINLLHKNEKIIKHMIWHITVAVTWFTFTLHGYTLSKVCPWHLASVNGLFLNNCIFSGELKGMGLYDNRRLQLEHTNSVITIILHWGSHLGLRSILCWVVWDWLLGPALAKSWAWRSKRIEPGLTLQKSVFILQS